LLHPLSIFKLGSLLAPIIVMHSLDDESIANASLVRCTVKVVLCIRLFAECKAVPGFEMVVRPIEHAAPRLAVVAVLAGVSALVFALTYGQLFGVFDTTLRLGDDGYADMVKLLTAPPTLEDSHLRQTEWGAFLLYYLATFVMRLVFGSFTVALLVGSFNQVKVMMNNEHADLHQLPTGWTHPERQPLISRLLPLVWYVLTWRMDGTFAPHLRRAIADGRLVASDVAEIRSSTVKDDDKNDTQQHLATVSRQQLAAAVGDDAAARIVARLGVLPPSPRGGGDASGVSSVTNLDAAAAD